MDNDTLPLLITEVINLSISFIFFVLFTIRLITLRAFSKTDTYKGKHAFNLDYYPKLRILFCVVYICLSIAFFVSNIMTGLVRTDDTVELALGGFG